jgi:hypothetical protein
VTRQGVFASGDGITSTLSGDQWAQLNVIADGNDIGDYSPDGPRPGARARPARRDRFLMERRG